MTTVSTEIQSIIDRANLTDPDLRRARSKIKHIRKVEIAEASKLLLADNENWIVINFEGSDRKGWRAVMGLLNQPEG